MRRPFEMLHESIHALKRIGRQMAMGQVKGRGEKRKKEPGLLLTAMTLLERHAGMRCGAGRGNRTLN
ncbi:hypothetical protein CXG50_14020 [Pseudomonas plecoglossicida]|uniref:Uncharacterized protein n=1 Tax=Pseudomonas plecoglossicida TaxID=70775 RepID=A0A2A3M5C0_PSEDL|nr:hypothetical protein CMV24_11765 [Pseudomonas plecoglossicida]PJI75674.1 hypothetical protein CSW00_00735 [Pseudomonas sp. MR 02]PLP89652.1 hypothetical protein CX682_16955 [Pseudomonas sp. FFUP_PS_41]PLU88675.1 hypothetical protein CXG44_02930 [Pseudomonas plecoglossicida]PLU95232.1 hypothetical protein CXG45_04170 [Pseudomonas plecoglossicida]